MEKLNRVQAVIFSAIAIFSLFMVNATSGKNTLSNISVLNEVVLVISGSIAVSLWTLLMLHSSTKPGKNRRKAVKALILFSLLFVLVSVTLLIQQWFEIPQSDRFILKLIAGTSILLVLESAAILYADAKTLRKIAKSQDKRALMGGDVPAVPVSYQ